MSTHKTVNDLLVDYVLGQLSQGQCFEVRSHVATCRQCADELKRLEALIRCTNKMTGLSADERACRLAKDRVLAAVSSEEKLKITARPSVGRVLRWRILMKNPISKLAIAAAVIIAVVIGVHQFAGSVPTFAQVVRPLLAARTATFTLDADMKDQPPASAEGMFAEPGRLRMTIKTKVGDKETEQIQIMDCQQGKMLGLSPESKMAVLLDIQNQPPETKQSQVNMFEEIRKRIRQAQQNVDESVKYLGSQQVDGVRAIGYRVSEPSGVSFAVWANAETLLPVRIEYSIGEILGQEVTVVMKNFAFDVPLDERLFSLEVPEGYQVQTMPIDASQPTENDLIETLRLWTDTTNGKFPSGLNMKTMFEEFGKAYGQKNQVDFKKNLEPSDPRFKQFMDAFAKVSRGIQFVLTLPTGSDWQYVGKDASFGDAKTAILWYRLKDSPTYRVIYADLKVADVARENLPK